MTFRGPSHIEIPAYWERTQYSVHVRISTCKNMARVGLVVQDTVNNSPVVETKGTNYEACAETLCMYALITLFLPSFYNLLGLASHSKDARRRLYPPWLTQIAADLPVFT